ncbi:MAG: hypothetical protein V3S89_09580 [Desulfobacterales bacterium]
MRPQGDYILNTVATNLITRYVPEMVSDHGKAELGLMSVLLMAVSEEFDRAAHRRIEENRALGKLFAESLPVVKDDDLKHRLETASKKETTDWRISSLDQLNCEQIELLIELHAHIETLADEEARTLEAAIWQELKDYSRRREFMLWALSQAMMAAAQQG